MLSSSNFHQFHLETSWNLSHCYFFHISLVFTNTAGCGRLPSGDHRTIWGGRGSRTPGAGLCLPLLVSFMEIQWFFWWFEMGNFNGTSGGLWFFPRASERRVLIVEVCCTSSIIFICSHLHLIFWSSDLHTFTSSHLHIFTSSHLLIFTSSHLLSLTLSLSLSLFSSSNLLIFTSSHLHVFSSSRLLSLSPLLSLPLSLSISLSLCLLLSVAVSLLLFLYFLCSLKAAGSADDAPATFLHEMRFECQKLG